MKKMIFVVDDKGHLTAEMALSDLRMDFYFIGFRSTVTALEVLDRSLQPNLVILANQIHEMNSADFLDALKQKSIRVPVVMVGSTPPEELGPPGGRGECQYVHMPHDEGIGYEVMQAVRKFST